MKGGYVYKDKKFKIDLSVFVTNQIHSRHNCELLYFLNLYL